MRKSVGHIVRRPGLRPGAVDIEIPVAEDLVSVPGTPVRDTDISYYSRVDPLKNPDFEKAADMDWTWTVISDEVGEYRKAHNERIKPYLKIAETSGDEKPVGQPESDEDLTDQIQLKAREIGFGEAGFTRYDRRYTYTIRKNWVRYPHAICLALEQDYIQTQAIPSLEGEIAHYYTYEIEAAKAMELADYIRSLGYHAQLHLDSADSGAYIPMFVDAGLGQLGANGQLLSPHFGSRARLAIITTDAPVTYDEPVDYGMNRFCQECQVCVTRCPGRALIRDKIWWRGAHKNKVIYERCRPVMSHYDGCGVCMKVCPIQRYGMKPVMEHYVETGEILGKGTDNLEGYTLPDHDYQGPGRLPRFSRDFFEIPNCTPEEYLFRRFKERLQESEPVTEDEMMEFADRLKESLDRKPIY